MPEPTLAEIRRALREAPDLRPAHLFAGMPFAIKPERARGVNAVYVFDLEGEDGGRWTVRIADGRCETEEGTDGHPDVVIGCHALTFLDLATGVARPGEAFVEGRLQVKGDLALAMRFSRFFGS